MSRRPRTKTNPKPPGRRDGGVLASNFPKPQRWKIDQDDYVDDLSPQDREWLAGFNDAYYGGDFRSNPEGWSPEQRRQAWSDQRASRQDAYGLSGLANGPDEVPENQVVEDPDTGLPLTRDWSHTPGYLDSDEYREARDAFRKHLGQHRGASVPEQTLAYLRARRHLDVVTPTAPLVVPHVRPKKKPTK